MILCFILSSCNSNTEKIDRGDERGIQHGIIYYKDGRFAGWPANNGIWSWGNEILVGFEETPHKVILESLHTLNQSKRRDKYARSQDGGLTWMIEDAYEHGQTRPSMSSLLKNNVLPDDKANPPMDLSESINFNHSDFALTFVRETNDIDPSNFYYSYNRGKIWRGPFKFPNLGPHGVATRTDYIVDGKHELMAFLTVGKNNNREGRIVTARTNDGGITWEQHRDPVPDTGRGGFPPALVKLNDGRLALAYIYRIEHGSRVNVSFSNDEGRNWSDEIILRYGDGATRECWLSKNGAKDGWETGVNLLLEQCFTRGSKTLPIYCINNI